MIYAHPMDKVAQNPFWQCANAYIRRINFVLGIYPTLGTPDPQFTVHGP